MTRPPSGLVRIVSDGVTAGTGFLVSDNGLIATCTHLVAEARGNGGTSVVFQFGPPSVAAETRAARIDRQLTRPADAEDVAFLRLAHRVPDGVEPLVLGTSQASVGGEYRTFGFPEAKPVEGMAGAVRVTGRTSEGGFDVLQVRSNEVSRGFSGAPVWDERGAVVGMVMSVARPDELGRQTEVSFVRPVEQLLDICSALRPSGVMPYRGLAVFEEQHADDYFGRDAATEELVDKLASRRFVAVVGISGSGKSSLVRAGLKKGLDRFPVPGLRERARCIVIPGSAPILDVALALAAAPGLTPATVGNALGLDRDALVEGEGRLRVAGDELGRAPPDEVAHAIRGLARHGLLLIVDQFERLFTEARDDIEQRRFIATLVAMSSNEVKVLITLRADFYGLALSQPGLDAVLTYGQLTLLPMTDPELMQVIEEPARRYGRRFEAGLPQRLIADVRGRPGDLPLLEFALAELWSRDAATGVLTAATYDRHLGYRGPAGRSYPGVQGAIAKRAEDLWNRLEPRERSAARRVFLSVIGAGPSDADTTSAAPAVSRRAWLIELDDVERAIAERLATARLLTTGRDNYSDQPTIEVAHEALIRAWPLLREWSTSFRPFVRWRDHELAPLWQRWVARDRDPELLLPSGMLDEAGRWSDQFGEELSPSHLQYIAASIAAAEERAVRREAELAATKRLNRRLRAVALGLATLVVVAGVATALAIQATRVARSQRREALSRALAAQAQAALDQDLDLAALLSLEAYRADATVEARSAINAVLPDLERTEGSLRGHVGYVAAVAFSPDGTKLASGGFDGTVRLWDLTTHHQLGAALEGHSRTVSSVAFSPNGTIVASGSSDHTVRLWSLARRKPIGQALHMRGDVESVAFSPDGTLLAYAGDDDTVRLWDLTHDRPLGPPLVAHTDTVESVAFSPDGRKLASAADDETVRLWSVRSRHQLGAPLRGHTDAVESVAFSPDGRTLASAGDDKTIRLWGVRSHRQLGAALRRHTEEVEAIAFSPDGGMLASAADDKTVRLWDVRRHRQLGTPLRGHSDRVDDVAFSPDGRTLASAGFDEAVRIWDVTVPRPVSRLLGRRQRPVESVALSPDGRTMASGGDDRAVQIWDVATRRPIGRPLAGHRGAVTGIAFSPEGKTLASSGRDGTVRLWDVATHRRIGAPLDGHDGAVTSVAFSPDRTTLASAGTDGTVRLWDVRDHQPRGAPWKGARDAVESVAFSPDGKILASASFDKTIRLWDVTRHRPLGLLPRRHFAGVNSVAFTPDGKILASAANDKTVRLWDIASRRSLGEPLTGHADAVTSVAFSPDGATLASGSADNTVRLWDVATHRALGPALPHDAAAVTSIAFSADGARLASASKDGTVRLWDAILWSRDWDELRTRACAGVHHDITRAEWAEFLPGEPFHTTCGQS